MKKRIICILLSFFAVAALYLLQPTTVSALETETRYCQGCKENISLSSWTAIGGEQTETLTLEAGKHYYLQANLTGTPSSGVLVQGAGCLDLNGFNVTAGTECIAISCSAGTTNLMGTGTVTGTYTTASYGATIHTASSAVVNLYGGTYKKTGNNSAVYVGSKCKVYMHAGAEINTAGTFETYPTAVLMEKSSGLFHMYGGTIIGGTTTGNGGSVRVSNGSFIMDGGTISGGQANRGGNIAVNDSGKFTMNDGTISSGTATATYGGGNIYTNKRAITIGGGLITLGTAAGTSYGGGNIGIYRATVNITGGTISAGSATNADGVGGGNIYAEGDIAVLNISGGTITGGNALGDGGGNICCKKGELNITGGTISDGSTTDSDALGGGNLLLVTAAANMTAGTITGGLTGNNGGNVLVTDSSFIMDGGTITGGQAARGGNVAVREDGLFTVNDGTLSSGTATQSYGGGNIYTNKCVVTINNGLITEGIATGTSYGGGNIGIYKGTLNMNGGTVSDGRATATNGYGGGNVYVEGASAVLNMKAGVISHGYLANGMGNNVYIRSGKAVFGAESTLGKKGEGTKGSMSLYMLDGTLESAGTNAGGLSVQEGNVSLTGGKYYSLYYLGQGTCTITGGVFRANYSKYVPAGYQWLEIASSDSYIYKVLPDADILATALVDREGKEVFTDEPLAMFATDTYEYIKLYKDFDAGDLGDRELKIDLNGKNLTVAGAGKLHAFDSANDTYDATACGTITNNGTVEISQDVQAPNDNRYLALTQDGTITMHRLDVRLSGISLRPSAMGVYYKALYNCDDTLAEKVSHYGVVMSVNNMPGADFLTETGDTNRYTAAAESFQNGVVATSGAVFGIMKESRDAAVNSAYGEITIYANPYILLDIGEGILVVGDNENTNKVKTDADFTGKAFSLRDVMETLDDTYFSYNETVRAQLDAFYDTWKDKGMDWDFANIGQNGQEEPEEKLELVDGKALCAVCQETVTWKALDQETYSATPYGNAANGDHLYLAEDITYTGTAGNGFLMTPGADGQTACLHLNGCVLTTTADRAFYGSAGVLNVMGSGVVIGYTGTTQYGAVAQISTSSNKTAINLYGGTYRQADNSHSGSYVIVVRDPGGAVNVYENARIEANVSGKAIRIGKSTNTESLVGLYDATVDGSIYLAGATSTNFSQLILENTTVNSTVDANGVNNITLREKCWVKLLDVEKKTALSVDDLDKSASIALRAEGRFAEVEEQAAEYITCFSATDSKYKVLSQGNTLLCIKDYNSALTPDASGNAYCPVCGKTVQWVTLSAADAQVQLTSGQHIYLTQSVTYEKEGAFIVAPSAQGQSACLHLNGYDITATAGEAILSNYGILNVMGAGTVTGYTDSVAHGAVTVDAAAEGAAINLYGGTYKKYTGSVASAGAVSVGPQGGTLNLYGTAMVDSRDDCAIYVGTGSAFQANLLLKDALVEGAVVLTTPASADATVTVDGAMINGKLDVVSGTNVAISGRPVLSDLSVAKGTLVNVENLLKGGHVTVSAEGIFTNAIASIRLIKDNFTADKDNNWIVVQEKALCYSEKKMLPEGGKILVIGNSMTYYGKYVIDRQHQLSLDNRVNDQGYLYQMFRANGYDVSITNFTYGGHRLEDFYSGKCAANRGHNGYNHLNTLAGQSYDYVIFQEGSEAAGVTDILAECQPLMDFFRQTNPNTKFVFIVQDAIYRDNHAWQASIKELDNNGVIVVDWGAMVNDLINGKVTVPGATESYGKFTFTVNKSASDGRHPNILSGYVSALMTYCAITGESAVGKDCSFWNDTTANSAFNITSYMSTYYAYDKTSPSNTNFQAIFESKSEMEALQGLMDDYLENKGYRDYQ